MRKAFIFISLLTFISGCGSDLAPNGATVTGPQASTTTLTREAPEQIVVYRAMDFVVTNGNGDLIPKVEIEFFAGGSAYLSDFNGNALSTPEALKDETDDRGIGRVSVTIPIPACTNETDVVTTGSLVGSVGVSDHLWTGTVTRTCATTAPAAP